MVETTMRFVVEFREKLATELEQDSVHKMSLSELLYHVLFGDGRMEPVQEMQN